MIALQYQEKRSLSYLPQADEQALLASGLPALFINELLATEARASRFENRLALLRNFTVEPKCDESDIGDAADIGAPFETKTLIPRVPAGPWRSLGGCFDYSHWHDRGRFLELDRALASSPCRTSEEASLSGNIAEWIEDAINS